MSDQRRGLQARYVHRVTPEDVGQRVSVRYALERPAPSAPPGSNPPLTDVIGRLVAADDDALLIVDRHEQLHVVASSSIVASRTVPPHPRREPEPMVGTSDAPLARRAARTLLVDDHGRTLLIGHVPAADRVVWTAPGGGLRPGEEHLDAAARELREEVGITPAIGPWIWWRRVTFSFRGLWIDQDERWYLVRTTAFDPARAPLTDPGVTEARWWSSDELRTPDIEVAPAALADHLDVLRRDGPPPEPIDVGR